MGIRVVNVAELPGGVALTAVAAVEASVAEAGEYPVSIELVEPDDARQTLAEGRAAITTDVQDAAVPTGLIMTAVLGRPFRIDGQHRLIARVGNVEASYLFAVHGPAAAATATPARARRSKGAVAGASRG